MPIRQVRQRITAASARTHPSLGIHACKRRSARVPKPTWGPVLECEIPSALPSALLRNRRAASESYKDTPGPAPWCSRRSKGAHCCGNTGLSCSRGRNSEDSLLICFWAASTFLTGTLSPEIAGALRPIPVIPAKARIQTLAGSYRLFIQSGLRVGLEKLLRPHLSRKSYYDPIYPFIRPHLSFNPSVPFFPQPREGRASVGAPCWA